ncbi:hypothetical protein HmCmsJML164_04290 [Escherichia coli]|nr:hypothetical protein HmCmsJML164_04290 [Escherichia coli]
MTVEDIITKYQSTIITTNKLFTDNKCLRKTIRTRLHFVLKIQAPLATVTQQLLKTRSILWRTNNQNIANTR